MRRIVLHKSIARTQSMSCVLIFSNCLDLLSLICCRSFFNISIVVYLLRDKKASSSLSTFELLVSILTVAVDELDTDL